MVEFLEVKNLFKSFGKEKVLQNLNFSVSQGKILAILGSSGCGKSTSLRIISGLVKQDKGEVILEGKNIDNIPVNKRNIGFVFQNYSLFPYMTVKKNIEFGLKVRHVKTEFIKQQTERLMDLINLKGMENKKPNQLSGGQQQRVALARALAIEPKLLLLDEPFGALDAKIRRRLRRDLKNLQRELGITMIFVTHDQEEAFEVGDTVAIMNNGRIEQVGLPRDLYDNPTTTFVAKFIGNMNVIKLPKDDKSDDLEVLVRPEDVLVEKYKNNGGKNRVSGFLTSYVFLGPIIEIVILLDNKDTLISLLPKSEFIKKGFRRGDRLNVKITKFRHFPNE